MTIIKYRTDFITSVTIRIWQNTIWSARKSSID